MASEVSLVSPPGEVGVFAGGESAGLRNVEGVGLVGGETGIGAHGSPRSTFLPISICIRCSIRALAKRASYSCFSWRTTRSCILSSKAEWSLSTRRSYS